MIKKLWDFFASLRLTFWLLIIVMTSLFAGAAYSGVNYSFFISMNEMPVQDWLIKNALENISKIWWLLLLFVSMIFLGINTFICMINRIISLLPKRNKMAPKRFFHQLTPSLIHGLFIVILLGHLITFTAGEWERVNIQKGMDVKIGNSGDIFNVTSISHMFYPDDSLLKQRIRNTEVVLNAGNGDAINLKYLSPVFYNGNHIFLDMKKIKKNKIKNKSGLKYPESTHDEETCNKAEHYHHLKTSKSSIPRILQLRRVFDPGLPIILIGFIFILMLMLWYYIEAEKKES